MSRPARRTSIRACLAPTLLPLFCAHSLGDVCILQNCMYTCSRWKFRQQDLGTFFVSVLCCWPDLCPYNVQKLSYWPDSDQKPSFKSCIFRRCYESLLLMEADEYFRISALCRWNVMMICWWCMMEWWNVMSISNVYRTNNADRGTATSNFVTRLHVDRLRMFGRGMLKLL